MHSNSFNEQNTEREGQKQSVLFNLAIIIMGTVSCYTTAMGLQPMLGNKIFSIANPNDSQAFGITLEPEGGSKTPTLEQLYTIGVVDS